MTAILRDTPSLSRVQPLVSPALDGIVGRCLAKDPDQRWQSSSDLRFALETIRPSARDDVSPLEAPDKVAAKRRTPRAVAWAVSSTALLALGLLAGQWMLPSETASGPSLRLDTHIGVEANLQGSGSVVLSDDGTLLAFVAQPRNGRPQLYVRSLSQLTARPVPGTEDAEQPFFSPDGQWLGFRAQGRLKKVPVDGGDVVTIADVGVMRSRPLWTDNGDILFTAYGSNDLGLLMRVPAAGGVPEGATKERLQFAQRWPDVLPGGSAVLYSEGAGGGSDDWTLVAVPARGTAKVVLRDGYAGRYVPTGHLLYMREQTLFAVPFDARGLEVLGQPVPLMQGLEGEFSISRTGVLAFVTAQSSVDVPLNWMDRAGRTTVLRAAPANWNHPRLSPDGRRLAIALDTARNLDIWIVDVAVGSLTRVTSDPAAEDSPVWSPDGTRIAFRRDGDALYWQRVDGSGTADLLVESTGGAPIDGLSYQPDGRGFVTSWGNQAFTVSINGDEVSGWKTGQPTSLFTDSARGPELSPDGRWMAYWGADRESAMNAVWVRAYPRGGETWRVSTGNAVEPIWSRAKNELLYREGENGVAEYQLMAVPFTTDNDTFLPEAPRPWSPVKFPSRPLQNPIDLHPDGARIVVAPLETVQRDRVTLVFNVFEELRRLVPVN